MTAKQPNHNFMDAEAVLRLIEEAKDKFFSVTFVKRTDGTVRTMNCRRNVGGGANVPAESSEEIRKHNVFTVYDVKASGFRRIPLDSVLEIKT
jgi:hypothetical protein